MCTKGCKESLLFVMGIRVGWVGREVVVYEGGEMGFFVGNGVRWVLYYLR